MGHCQKHGLYSTLCRACDLDTIKDNQIKEDTRVLYQKILFDKGYKKRKNVSEQLSRVGVVDIFRKMVKEGDRNKYAILVMCRIDAEEIKHTFYFKMYDNELQQPITISHYRNIDLSSENIELTENIFEKYWEKLGGGYIPKPNKTLKDEL